jgi:hypothetical protein
MTTPKRKLKITLFSIFTLLVCAALLISALIANNGIQDLEKTRDTRLVHHEYDKEVIKLNIEQYLKVKDDASFKYAKEHTGMTNDLASKLYGEGYDSTRFYGASSVSYIDHQYTIDEKDSSVIYLLVTVTKDNKPKKVNMVVFSKGGIIYDILAY